MKFSINDFFSKCEQIRRKLKKSLTENFIFYAVTVFGVGCKSGHKLILMLVFIFFVFIYCFVPIFFCNGSLSDFTFNTK